MSKKTKTSTQSTDEDKKATKEPEQNMFREIFEILMYGLALLVFFTRFVWQNFQIPTSSMENTLLIGDHIAANTFIFKNSSEFEKKIFPFRDLRRGDIVVFKYPEKNREDWIKRCIGLPGDTYEVRNDQVYINGGALKEEYPFYKAQPRNKSSRDPDNRYYPLGYHENKPGLENGIQLLEENLKLDYLLRNTSNWLYEYRTLDKENYARVMGRLQAVLKEETKRIPEGFYLMMGDNRNLSYDSRKWGLVPREMIEGKAYFVWWSYGEDEKSHELQGGELIWSYLRVPIEFFRRTHWKESMSLIK